MLKTDVLMNEWFERILPWNQVLFMVDIFYQPYVNVIFLIGAKT